MARFVQFKKDGAMSDEDDIALNIDRIDFVEASAKNTTTKISLVGGTSVVVKGGFDDVLNQIKDAG